MPSRILQRAHRRHHIDINCVDSLGRGSLTIAIDGENLEMVELLVIMGVHTKDALLQAINAEFVEAVELLLEHEELIHLDGEPYVSADCTHHPKHPLGVLITSVCVCSHMLHNRWCIRMKLCSSICFPLIPIGILTELAESRNEHQHVHAGHNAAGAGRTSQQL